MKLLPYGSTILFSKNGKCTQDYNTPLFCLVNNTIYKVEENNQSFILNISEFNDDIYYEFNILNNTNIKNITCILSYIYHNKINFLYNEIFEENPIIQKNFNTTLTNIPINNLNCQKEFFLNEQRLVCFYIDRNKNLKQIYFNLNSNFINQNIEPESINDKDLNLNNSFIIFSLLKNQVKYFLCLNSTNNILKIYTKKNFPFNYGRRLVDPANKFNDFTFKCENKESLLIFSILDNQNNERGQNYNCLSNYVAQNYAEYYFFLESKNQLSLSSYNNINCLNEAGMPGQKQIFFIKLTNETMETSIETTKPYYKSNYIDNISSFIYFNFLSTKFIIL